MAEIVETVAERMAAGGDALARMPDGRVLFAEGALPGERVRVQVTQAKKDFARGVVADVLEVSPHRVVPPCPEVARGCGGCSWQHADSAAQLVMKADVVRDALRRTARMPDATVVEGGSVPAHGYRTTVRLAVRDDGDAAEQRGEHRVGDEAVVHGHHPVTRFRSKAHPPVVAHRQANGGAVPMGR
ncbi:MAG: hypothetical protein RI900_1371, partial [Actinomycetota bacterium]